MKLFKSLLVAPAALGLLAPISASASEVNLNDISNYSDVESIDFANSFDNDEKEETLIAGGEGLVDSYDGGFSETTTASFGLDMYLGAFDDDDSTDDDSVMAGYSLGIGLNTSFTGEDSLDIAIDAGVSGEVLLSLTETQTATHLRLTEFLTHSHLAIKQLLLLV